MSSRLSLALDAGQLVLPDGPLLAFGLGAQADLSALPPEHTTVVQPFFPDHAALSRRGLRVTTEPQGPVAAALVVLPRAKPLAREWIAQACQSAAGGLVLVDGQKTDGVESLLKEVRQRAPITGSLSKAHGRLFWFTAADFSDWFQGQVTNRDGYQTRAGVFSADGVDPASALLAANLPANLKGRIADLGAGWGYLAAQLCDRDAITQVHLIEADLRALDCARVNIRSDKAHFHWADATDFTLPNPMDAVVMNPPFHTGRAAEPELGKRFIQAAARLLKPSGQLFLVANRHLPYETILTARFGAVKEGPGDNRFKIIVASKPRR